MARTEYPFNSDSQVCSMTAILVVLNIDRPDADLKSIGKKVKQLLRKNKMRVCKTLQGSLNKLLTHYYRHDWALPTHKELSLYEHGLSIKMRAKRFRKEMKEEKIVEVIDLTLED